MLHRPRHTTRRHARLARFLTAATAAFLAACDGDGGLPPQRTPYIGWIADAAASVIAAPDLARVGSRVTVQVTTIGSSSCTVPAGARLSAPPPDAGSVFVAPPAVVVTPYDYARDAACTRDLASHPRPVHLRMPSTPGDFVVIVRGRRVGRDELHDVQHWIEVMP